MDRDEFKKLYPDVNNKDVCYPCNFNKPMVYEVPRSAMWNDYLVSILDEVEKQGIDLFPTVRKRIY